MDTFGFVGSYNERNKSTIHYVCKLPVMYPAALGPALRFMLRRGERVKIAWAPTNRHAWPKLLEHAYSNLTSFNT